jgi:membrane dipeptidase
MVNGSAMTQGPGGSPDRQNVERGAGEDWRAFHDGCFVVDGHDDLMVDVLRRRLHGERQVLRRIHLPKLRRGGVDLQVLMVGGDHSTMFDGADQPGWALAALRAIDELYQEVEESAGECVIATSAAHIQQARVQDKIAFLLHFEGGRPLEGQLGLLRTFYRLGVRSLGLVWFLRNQLADSCAERRPAGLSHFGAAVVREAERLGILIDIAHLSEPGALDVLELVRKPIVASHANAKAIQGHPRNLSDTVLRRLAANGGVVGLAAFPPFVSERKPTPTLNDLLDHADYIRRLVGVEHLGLGLDFIDFAPEVIAPYHAAISQPIGLDLGHADLAYPAEIADATMLPNITRALLERGYSKDDVAKVLGGNFLRVMGQVLVESEAPSRAAS